MNQDDENERLLAEIERLRDLLRSAIIDAKIAAQLRKSIHRNAKMAAALKAVLVHLDDVATRFKIGGPAKERLVQQIKDALEGCNDAELRQYMPTTDKPEQAP